MEPDDYSSKVFTYLDAIRQGQASAIDELDAYQREVLEFFRTMMQGPSTVSMAQTDALLKRCDDLIDKGTGLGAKAVGLVETLGKVHRSIASEMQESFEPEAREVLHRYLGLRAAMRSPVLRDEIKIKRVPTDEGKSKLAVLLSRMRAMFHKA